MTSLVLCLLIGGLEPADVPPAEYLWLDAAPGAVGNEEQDRPCVFVYRPDEDLNTGAALVLCPGGGYAVHAMDHEGHQVANFFRSQGVTVALLRYRLGGRYRHPAPLQDVSRAIRYVRSRHAEWAIDPNRVGVMGFSAGGHLASTVSTHFSTGEANADDPIERFSCRPDFSILCYPVISLTADYSHSGSGKRLLGANASIASMNDLSNDQHVTSETPPAFLFQTSQDTAVPAQNSLAYAMACANAGVECELHLFRYGPHGVGMALTDPAASQWRDLAIQWMRQSGFLTSKPRTAVSGTVTFNGEPIQSGEIAFVPDDRNAPVASMRFGRGRFRFSKENGPVVGTSRVRVLHTGAVKPLPTIEAAVEVDRDSLIVNLIDGENTIDLDLTAPE